MAGRVTVLGAGNGGCAIAAELTRREIPVSLFTRSEQRLAPLRERGGIDYVGTVGEGFARIDRMTTDIVQALDGADLIVISTPTTAHGWYAHLLAPHLKAGQHVMLNPGHTGGGLHFVHSLRSVGFTRDVKVCETVSLSHASRMAGPATVRILALMTRLRLAAFPAEWLDELHAKVKGYFPNVVPAPNVLDTGMLNLNAMEHPPGMLLNAGWIEFSKGEFNFYSEGISPSVARVIQLLDDERLAAVAALNRRAGLGIQTTSFIEYFHQVGFTSERAVRANDMYMALQDSEPNRFVRAPSSLDHRYINEDVGYGLVPIYELGRMAGVDMPVTRLMIDLASVVRGVDYWREGLTLDKMGLAPVSVTRLRSFLEHGRVEG
jgi:opine dehydrogenase